VAAAAAAAVATTTTKTNIILKTSITDSEKVLYKAVCNSTYT
jgi:hypothetical protein